MLADFFRRSLDLGSRIHIPLNDELALILEFLTIETSSFGTRLKVEQDIKTECQKVMVPPLLLQPLVENAVRHGIANLVEGGTIRIHLRGNAATGLLFKLRIPSTPTCPAAKEADLVSRMSVRASTLFTATKQE